MESIHITHICDKYPLCHKCIHIFLNDFGKHEVVGIVTKLGQNAKKIKIGDHVGVGCMVYSCLKCEHCTYSDEQYCNGLIWTYNSLEEEKVTIGGYSTFMVFICQIPKNLSLDGAAPLLCAGITVYSPMKHFGLTQPGKNFGVVGLRGLGHMTVKFGKAFGMTVMVISTSPFKEKEACEILGVDNFIVSRDPAQMKNAEKSLDYILDTVDGKIVMVGLPHMPLDLPAGVIIFGKCCKTVEFQIIAFFFVQAVGSFIGSIKETQDMLNFCGIKNVTSMIELVPMNYVNEAMKRLCKSGVKYRFVLDMKSTFRFPSEFDLLDMT
ncbi:hypothetical protein SELMODRAFT_231648 [Selaginella moellendorffii]|uniref:Uncharacterized protein n=1 Tax=Selaginella moellendorffii TaxID=88036 RepID=D8RHV5_SELML|nr:hypothetical protein SELMODRAFT_231648 [Selaginella moellendorffii]